MAVKFTRFLSPLIFVPLSLGQDATEAFEDVGHSDEARALLPGMFVGDFEKGSVSTQLQTPLQF